MTPGHVAPVNSLPVAQSHSWFAADGRVMRRYHAAVAALVLPLGLASAVGPATSARADDTCSMTWETFGIENVRMDRRAVSVSGLGTAAVGFTMTTRTDAEPTPGMRSVWNRMQLRQAKDGWDGPVVHLRKVSESESGRVATWRGAFQATGPTRTITFDRAVGDTGNCEMGRFPVPTGLPSLRVTARNTPVIRPTNPRTTQLRARSYTVSGRVLSTSGRPYGRRLRVVVGQNPVECETSNAGVATRTDAAGRFTVTLRNVPTTMWGAPVAQAQCLRLTGSSKDALGNVTDLATARVEIPWTHRFVVTAPRTIRRGKPATLHTFAPLPFPSDVRVERLHGRTVWRALPTGGTRDPEGPIEAYFIPDTLGRHTYRLRTADSRAVSPPFVMTTVR